MGVARGWRIEGATWRSSSQGGGSLSQQTPCDEFGAVRPHPTAVAHSAVRGVYTSVLSSRTTRCRSDPDGPAWRGEHDSVLRAPRNNSSSVNPSRNVANFFLSPALTPWRCSIHSQQAKDRERRGPDPSRSGGCADTATTSCRTHGSRRSSWCVRRSEWEPT